MAFAGVKAAAVPPDEEHPYGHGKIESLAGFGESVLLLCIVVYITFQAISKLLHKPVIESIDIGVYVMAFSAVGCLVVSRYVLKVAKQTRSLALRSNGQHLTADCFTSIGVMAALWGTSLTGWHWLDPVVALVIAAWMCVGSWRLAHEAFHHLIDRRLSDEELQTIERLVGGNSDVLGYHRLRTRLSGNVRFIDMHIVVPNQWSVVQAHEVADELEKLIGKELAPAQVVIHVDPYDDTKAMPADRRGSRL
jgi:cation diffusion facilitator family transporter